MRTVYIWLHPALWLTFSGYWLVAARHTLATERRESILSRLSHIAPLVLGVWLFASGGFPGSWLNRHFVAWTPTQFWIGSVLVAAGLTFAVLARRHLGLYWSGTVTLKHGHELIRTGPYAWTRHPIYTGLLLAFAGSALALGEWRGVVAVALIAAAFVRKLRIEERFLKGQFPCAYPQYRAEVPALVPRPRFLGGRSSGRV